MIQEANISAKRGIRGVCMFWKKGNCTIEMTILVFENLWTECKMRWEQVKVDAANWFGGKASVNWRKVSPINVGYFLSHSVTVPKTY